MVNLLFIYHFRHGFDDEAERPNFSQEALISQNGLDHSLDFIYYLKGARPTFALAAVLTSIHKGKSLKKYVYLS